MSAGPALAAQILAESTRLGNAWFMAIGPAVIFLAVVFWVAMTLVASRIRPRSYEKIAGLPDRGPVQGGVIKGSPSQLNRRDPASSATHREVMARVEYGRAGERAAGEKEEAGARGPWAERRAESRPRHRGRRRRRRFGPPRIR